jgi:hypothetical protein
MGLEMLLPAASQTYRRREWPVARSDLLQQCSSFELLKYLGSIPEARIFPSPATAGL